MKTETIFLYDRAGNRYQCDIADMPYLVAVKGWKKSVEDFKKPVKYGKKEDTE